MTASDPVALEPLVPSNCDLRKLDLPMPVDVMAILHRELLPMPDHIFAAHIRLMAWAWSSRPTGSILNSKGMFRLAMVSERLWKRDKARILTGFVLCSDNRFYHPGLCQAALKRFNRAPHRSQVIRQERLGVSQSEWRRLRQAVLRRDNHQCSYCGAVNAQLHCDHVIPLARGGSTTPENLVTACGPCNSSKSALLVEEWFK